MQRKKWSYPRIVVCFTLVVVLAHAINVNRRLFKRYVCCPIPKSVKNIKTHRDWQLSGHKRIIGFVLSKSDLLVILKSKSFRKATYVKYDPDYPHIVWSTHEKPLQNQWGLSLEGAPRWFSPHLWENAEVYVFNERIRAYQKHTQILFSNDITGEVLLLEYQEGSW